MEEQKEIKIGDFVRHRFLNKTTDLLVVLNNETKILARYVKDGIFYSEEFYLFEVEYYDRKPLKRPQIYVG
ncbi:hypothetical protein EZ449_05100 [Pedobacter frigidisoli]|uniref:Uncharacterized protein n=1 Tax=Pedobacter frigidisoli TaxID=2530455 RepID=A0A4R0P4T2_9SPHI|nr:hypothetical protein [Pedobacter frigidisoli]TCD11639.1 hypothetical protein EZ449_05100 [Pedobacter frigidisoli]